VWRYEGGSPRIYTFRWGASYEMCEVTGPIRLNLAPIPRSP
jgi:hypothetical protein